MWKYVQEHIQSKVKVVWDRISQIVVEEIHNTSSEETFWRVTMCWKHRLSASQEYFYLPCLYRQMWGRRAKDFRRIDAWFSKCYKAAESKLRWKYLTQKENEMKDTKVNEMKVQ